MKEEKKRERIYGRLPIYGAYLCLMVVTIPLALAGTGRSSLPPCPRDDLNCAIFAEIDFTPVDGSYRIGKKASGKMKYSDVEHFNVIIKLDRPAPEAFKRDFKIMEVKSYWPDAELGRLTASFVAGSTTATIVYNRQCCGASSYPTGAPAILNDGTFWKGCTKKGKIKANGETGDDGHAIVRLEKVYPSTSGGIGVEGKVSPNHTIRCP